jgi:Cys-rich protein (TIGR01571 family)
MPRTKTSPLAAHYDSLHSSEDSSPAKSNKLELMTPGVAITTATPVALPVHGQQQTSTSSDDTVLRTDEVGLSDSIVPQVSLQPWRIPFFDCFSPLDNRLISWCVPCINYGKTDHRMNVDTSMENYGPINGPCLLTAALYWFCPACLLVPFCMQRQEVREQYGLEGGDCTDCLAACFCTCCSVAQVEKEAKAREEERIANARGQGQYPQM